MASYVASQRNNSSNHIVAGVLCGVPNPVFNRADSGSIMRDILSGLMFLFSAMLRVQSHQMLSCQCKSTVECRRILDRKRKPVLSEQLKGSVGIIIDYEGCHIINEGRVGILGA
jgi:hypothetical protein